MQPCARGGSTAVNAIGNRTGCGAFRGAEQAQAGYGAPQPGYPQQYDQQQYDQQQYAQPQHYEQPQYAPVPQYGPAPHIVVRPVAGGWRPRSGGPLRPAASGQTLQ